MASTSLPYTETRRTCFIYSPGGHYAELLRALEGITFTNAYHVTFPPGQGVAHYDPDINPHYVTHPRRHPVRLLRNAWDSLKLLWKMNPKLIISTGADVTVPTIILGKLLFRCQVVFIESGGDITPTLTGRLVYPFCDLFIVQWKEKLKYFPRAVLADGVLL